jgi:phospholipase C
MSCQITTYDCTPVNCPHPDLADCFECRLPHCNIHLAECPHCGEYICQDCWAEHRHSHGLRENRTSLAVKRVAACATILAAGLVQAQTPAFSHVVVIIQENRTPDNLLCTCGIPGADLICSAPATTLLTQSADPAHGHAAFLSNQKGRWASGGNNYVSDPRIAPYCQLASQYGFADRMFQTNQGPSGPAHDFLLASSSQLSPGSEYFMSENVHYTGGCTADWLATFINAEGVEAPYAPPCLSIPSLPDLLNGAGYSWRYYTPSAGVCWNAPENLASLCQASGGKCAAADWKTVDASSKNVLSDIAKGNLATVSWIVPSAANSDHPSMNTGGGPAWVASIVNAIGNSEYWQTTAILLVWDDWGGFYDHVAPLSNSTGFCEQYCYGFRVPLVVISAYTPTMVDSNVHDFGSIAAFIENNFALGSLNAADAYADDLSEFFPQGASVRQFVTVEAVGEFDTEEERGPDED